MACEYRTRKILPTLPLTRAVFRVRLRVGTRAPSRRPPHAPRLPPLSRVDTWIGDRDNTEIVETHDGVFVGATHRLARVRKIDLKRRKDLSNERTAEAESGPRDAGGDARRHPEDTVRTPDSERQHAGGAAEGGSSHPTTVVDSDRGTGPSDQSGKVAPEAGRGGPLYTRRLAVALRVALRQNPVATRDLLNKARQLARAPLARVKDKIDGLEQRLKAELQDLTEPQLALPQLDDARRRLAEAKAHEEKVSAALSQAKERHAHYMLRRPNGVMASIRGETRKWAEGLTKIDARVANLETKSNDAWSRRKDMESVVTSLEKELQRRQYALRASSDQQKKILVCRQKIDRITVARQILDKAPSLAFGGLTLVMTTAAGATLVGQMFTRQVGIDGIQPT